MNIAIICARGGSRRLPRKNVKPFCGVPLVGWAVIQAKTSINIDHVVLSTDDDEIADVGASYGAEIIRRPFWPDADQAAANRPMLHALDILMERYGNDFEVMVSMLPTNPLILPGDIDRGIDLYRKYGCDTIRPLIPLREMIALRKTHPWRCRTEIFSKHYEYLGEGGNYNICNPRWYGTFNKEFSDLDAVLDDPKNWPATETYFFPVQPWQYSDVDTAEEFELAELIMEHYILKGRGMEVYTEYYKNNTPVYSEDILEEKPLTFEQILDNNLKKYGNIGQQ